MNALPGCSQPLDDGPPTLQRCVFIVLDASHAGHYSHLGYERETSPNIDALAAEGVAFTAAHSLTPNTLSSARNYLSGRYLSGPIRVVTYPDFAKSESTDTIAGAFAARGFQTAAYSQNPHVSEEFGFHIGFDHFASYDRPKPIEYSDGHEFEDPTAQMLEDAKEWIHERKSDAWFCYLHLLRPHNPYYSPEPYLSRWNNEGYAFTDVLDYEGNPVPQEHFLVLRGTQGDLTNEENQYLTNLYDGNIRYVDSLLGSFFSWMKDENILNSTLIIVTSDHGEAFMQHGLGGHNATVYEEMIHVPLVLSSPANAGFQTARIDSPVELVDLFPTLVELFDLQPKTPCTDDRYFLCSEENPKNTNRYCSPIPMTCSTPL